MQCKEYSLQEVMKLNCAKNTGIFVRSWERFCKIFSESSTGRWAVLQLQCCPSRQEELSENIKTKHSHDLMNNPILIVTRSDNFSFGIVITFISHTSPIITVFRRSLCGLITHHVGSSYAITAAMNEHEAIRSPSVALLSTLSVLVTHSITRRFK